MSWLQRLGDKLLCAIDAHDWHYCEEKLRECRKCQRSEVRGEDDATTWTQVP